MDAQLLDANDVRRAILTFGDDSHVSGHHNPYFATELARALNDWTVDRWLCRRRLRLVDPRCGQLPDAGGGGDPAASPTNRAWSR